MLIGTVIISERKSRVLSIPKSQKRCSQKPDKEYFFCQHTLSDEISVFVFSSPCTSYTVSSSCSSSILRISRRIESKVRICITDILITPIILVTHSPARTLMIHNSSEIFVFDFTILVDDIECSTTRYRTTSFITLSEDSISECPAERSWCTKRELYPLCRITSSVSYQHFFCTYISEIIIIEKSCEVRIIILRYLCWWGSLDRISHITVGHLDLRRGVSVIRIEECPSSSCSFHVTVDRQK